MAGNIYRALQRNPDFINSLASLAGQYGEKQIQEKQYSSLNDILNPETETTQVKMGDAATIPVAGQGTTAQLPRYQGVETTTTRTPRSILDLSPQEMLRIGSIMKIPAINSFNMLAQQESERRKLAQPVFEHLAPGTQPGYWNPADRTFHKTGEPVPNRPTNMSTASLALLAGEGHPDAKAALDLINKGRGGAMTEYQKESLDLRKSERSDIEADKKRKEGEAEHDKVTRRIDELTQRNLMLGQKIRDYYGSNLKPDETQSKWLEQTAKDLKAEIANNEAEIERLNKGIGGTWKRGDQSKTAPATTSKQGGKMKLSDIKTQWGAEATQGYTDDELKAYLKTQGVEVE